MRRFISNIKNIFKKDSHKLIRKTKVDFNSYDLFPEKNIILDKQPVCIQIEYPNPVSAVVFVFLHLIYVIYDITPHDNKHLI